MSLSESHIIVSFVANQESELEHLSQKHFQELQRNNPGFKPVFVKRTKVNLPDWAIGKTSREKFGEILLEKLQVNQ
jgi:hypothetical protein